MNYNPSSVMPNSITGIVGYRFHPTNEQLLIKYLKRKMRGDDAEYLLIIAEVNVCKHEPWDLPGKSNIKSDDLVWFFFCPRDFKYSKSRRSNRRTKEGFWKPTGKIVKIRAWHSKKQIGTKKTLVFYKKATPKALKTEWVIHEYEYTFDSNQSNQREYVLCKLKKKSDKKSNKGEPNHHTPSVSDFEAEPSCSMTPDFEYQNRSEMMANSACNGSEACDIEYQNSNDLMPNSSSHLMTSVSENQYSNELMSDSACDGCGSLCSMKDPIVNSDSDGSGLHNSMAPGFENQYSNDLIFISASDGNGLHHSVAPGFQNQYSNFQNQYSNNLISTSACDGSGLHHSMAPGFLNQYSNFQNQYSDNLISISACDGSGLHHSMAPGFQNQYSNFQNQYSNFQNQYSNNFISTSACDESGLHNSMAPGFENQYSNNLIFISASDGNGLHHSVAPGFQNQYSNNLISTSACGGSGLHHSMAPGFQNQYSNFQNQYSNNLISISACDGSGLHHSMAPGFQNQYSNFQNQYSNNLISTSACGGSGLHHSMAPGFQNQYSNFQNQYSNNLISISACDGSGLHHSMALGFQNQYPNFKNQYSNNLISTSACDGSGLHHSMASGFQNQYSNQLMSDSASDFENQYPIDLMVNSPCHNWLLASDFEDQVSTPLNSVCDPSLEMPPKFIDRSTYDKDDFGNQNHDKESNISASNEGACNPLMTAPLDLENRNPWEQTDMLTFKDIFSSYSAASFSKNMAADSALTEVSPQRLAEWEAFFELQNSLNSALQPSDMGFGTSVSS